MAGKKEQLVALVDAGVKDGADVLRIITRGSRARVIEDLLAPAVEAALSEQAGEVARVEALAARAGVDVQEYVTAYAKAYARDTYGPGLAALEKDDRLVTLQLIKAGRGAVAAPVAFSAPE